MKLVLDANVVISALTADSKTRELIVSLEPDLLIGVIVASRILYAPRFSPVSRSRLRKLRTPTRIPLTPSFVHDEIESYENLIVEKSGMEPDRVAQFIDLLFQYVDVVPTSEFDPGSSASYLYKDLRIATRGGEEYGTPQLITSTDHELYKSLEESGRGDLDFSGVMALYEELAGTDE